MGAAVVEADRERELEDLIGWRGEERNGNAVNEVLGKEARWDLAVRKDEIESRIL